MLLVFTGEKTPYKTSNADNTNKTIICKCNIQFSNKAVQIGHYKPIV